MKEGIGNMVIWLLYMFNIFRNQHVALLFGFVCVNWSYEELQLVLELWRPGFSHVSKFHEFRFDVLPVIPVFNLLNAIGVPFVDKTVTVSTLSKAIVAALEDETVTGVQRFPEMEELEKAIG